LGQRLDHDDGFVLAEGNITIIANGLFEAVSTVAEQIIQEEIAARTLPSD
jgi:hypothetical protein